MSKFMGIFLVILFDVIFPGTSSAQPAVSEVLKAMKNASNFMMNTVSNRGGFLEYYSDDFSMQWGEVPARKSMIWLYGTNTVEVGMMHLDAYEVTGDPLYLEYAKKTANAIVWGQHPLGGWHYFIDFDMTGTQQWYDDVLSKMWGFEEFYHYYGNCTYDDNATIGPARFLLRLYLMTLDPSYRVPLIKALDFVLMSQYPNGAWPQRYPLRYEFSHDGFPDYSSCYTFNDEVIQGNIFFLIEAWEAW